MLNLLEQSLRFDIQYLGGVHIEPEMPDVSQGDLFLAIPAPQSESNDTALGL